MLGGHRHRAVWGGGRGEVSLLTWLGWLEDGAARKGYPQVFQRLMTLVAWLLRHQLTVPCLCLFVTKDTVLSNYK